MSSFDLIQPTTAGEALELLAGGDPLVRPMGGGTALMLMMKAQFLEPVRLVSLRRVGGRFRECALAGSGEYFRIGAMMTFSELEHSKEIARHFPVVVETMKTLANVRVRNVATVGGNLAHADPHLDLPPVWMALGAEAVAMSLQGERSIPVEDLFAGYYETTLAPGEIIAEIRVPVRPSWRSNYSKVTTRAIHDWPALGIATSLDLAGDYVQDARVVLSAAVEKPARLRSVEDVLRGERITPALLEHAGEAAVAEAGVVGDERGSTEYKNRLLSVFLGRAIYALAGK